MKHGSDVKSILQRHLPELKKRYPIEWMTLFGSYARGEETADSDVDLLVDFNGPIGIEFVDLTDEIEKILNVKVDLVSKGGLKPRHWEYLKPRLTYV